MTSDARKFIFKPVLRRAGCLQPATEATYIFPSNGQDALCILLNQRSAYTSGIIYYVLEKVCKQHAFAESSDRLGLEILVFFQ